jgi:hypothetical protein
MIIRPHHVFMLPVDYIVFYRAVCTMGRDASSGTSVIIGCPVEKSQTLILLRCREHNSYHPVG